MEGGTKTGINLEAPLDVSSSDMLVPVGQPTFQHNWQKYQGKFLPNSLRYEQNGWAAGWHVHSFDYSYARIKSGSKYIGKSQLNDNPTYMLSLYDSEDSADALTSVFYNRSAKVVSVDIGSAYVSGNNIAGSFNGNNYTLVWNENTRTPSVSSGGNLSVETTVNNDYTTAFRIVDNNSALIVDMDIFTPDTLRGDKLSDQPFLKYEGGKCYWGDYSYDVASNKVTVPNGSVVTPVVSDTNKITFDYQETLAESISLNLELESKIIEFNDCKIEADNSNENMLIYADSTKTQDFDKIFGEVTPVKLTAGDAEGIAVKAQIAAWVSMSVEIPEAKQIKALKPDNTALGNVQVYIKDKKQTVTAESVFGGSVNTDFSDCEYVEKTTPPPIKITYYDIGWKPINLNDRYCRITLSNSLEADLLWQPYEHDVTNKTYCFSVKRFPGFNSGKTRTLDLLGNIYTFGDMWLNYSSLFEYNDIWNLNDYEAFFKKDISKIRSLKLKDTDPEDDETPDDQFVRDNGYTEQERLDAVCTLASTPATYSSSDIAFTDIADVFTGNKYIGGTYEQVPVVAADDDTFWPFEYVPCFNFGDLQQAMEDDGVTPKYEADGVTPVMITVNVRKCYYKDGTQEINDLDTFKKFVLGAYDASASLDNDVIKDKANYNRKRIVTKYVQNFDFTYIDPSSDNEDEQKKYDDFDKKWQLWYPDYVNPCTKTPDVSDDATYTDYDNVEIEESEMKIKWIPPAVRIPTEDDPADIGDDNIDNNVRVFTCNMYDVVITDQKIDNPDIKWHVYHQASDRSDLYQLVEKSYKYYNGVTYEESAFGFSSAYVTIDGTDYTLPFLLKSSSGPFKRIGYSRADLNDDKCTYNTMLGTFKAQASEAMCTVEAKDKSAVSPAWAERIEWNFPVLDVVVDWHGSSPGSTTPDNIVKIVSFDRSLKLNSSLNMYKLRSRPYIQATTFGAVLAYPVKAYVATKVTYPAIKTEKQFTTEGDTALIRTALPDSDPRVDKDRAIWFDRDGGKCMNLFSLSVMQVMPIYGDGTTGYMSVGFEVNDKARGYIFYGKKAFNAKNEEISQDFYCPGIAYDASNPENSSGSMGATNSSIGMFRVTWTPTAYTCIMSATASFKEDTAFDHNGFSALYAKMQELSVVLGAEDYTTLTSPVTIKLSDTASFNMVWFMQLRLMFGAAQSYNIEGCSVTVGPANEFILDTNGANVKVPMTINVEYRNNTARFLKLSAGYDALSASNDGTVTISKNGRKFSYNYIAQKLTPDNHPEIVLYGLKQHVKDEIVVAQNVTAVMPAAYYAGKSGNTVTLSYGGQNYAVDVSRFDNMRDVINVYSTDVRTPDKTKLIGSLDPSQEYQLVKQLWNSTVEVENFWWINATHVLVLDSYNFTLKRKTKEVDDWDGDRWEKVYEIARTNVLTVNMIKWFSCNVYGSNTDSLFVTLEVSSTDTVKCVVYDVIREMSVKFTVYFTLNYKSIGQKLNDKLPSGSTGYFNTYGVVTAAQLLSQGNWTNTIVDNKLIIGCSVSKNLDQWSSVIDIASGRVLRVVQGYGCVGLKGDLTGGQIPQDFFDVNTGFNGTVKPISYLTDADGDGSLDSADLDSKFELKDISELNRIDECIVGTAEQQWYVKKTLFGIVSHLEHAGNGTFVKRVIPMTNNFTSVYKSPSFANIALGDLSVQIAPFADLVPLGKAQAVWQTLLGFAGYPMLYYFAPRKSSLIYLQQTLGQYAYVHYNSSQSMPEAETMNSDSTSGMDEDKGKNAQAPVLSDVMTFGKQVIKQSASLSSNMFDFSSMMFFAFASALQVVNSKNSINESLQQTAVSDVGKKYTQAALENLSAMLSSSVMTQSSDSGMQSTIVGLKSLDMFYSTSDKQNVFAGPGFVEHQFVADCVAQSTVDVRAQGNVMQLMFVVKALTTFQMEITNKALDLVQEGLIKVGESLDNVMVCGTAVGVGMASKIPAYVAKGIQVVNQIGTTAANSILDTIASKGITCEEQGRLLHQEMNNEAKHKYGEKNEVFMWPCWGVPSNCLDYSDEHVECGVKDNPITVSLAARKFYKTEGNAWSSSVDDMQIPFGSTMPKGNLKDPKNVVANHEGKVPYYQAACYGVVTTRKLPADMAKIEGVSHLLPSQAFKNENVSASDPVFAATAIHDYIIDKSWNLSQCCTGGMVEWITCKDTKLINGPASNMYVNSSFCGVASPYTAVEVKRGMSKKYMRPWAITPNTLAFNVTGYNTVLDNILYHSFDGISYRLVELVGSPGMGKNRMSWLYAFQLNDRFKRSNKCPPMTMLGNFEAEPVQYVKTVDKFWTILTTISKEKGLAAGAPGEDKDVIRWSVPVFTEPVTTLPAAVKTLTAVPLVVVDGVTGLATDLVSFLSAYKAPLSVDFTIGKNVYRMTEEYICSVTTQQGVDIVEDLVPALGLKFIGASPLEAYFYSRATRCYYVYTGGTSLTKMDMMERFRNIQKGYWDFVNQEVVMPCLMTFKRLNKYVEDKDTETDNIIVPVMSGNAVSGELPPPLTTIFDDRSWYKAVSLPCGFAYQGPNRVIINRSVFVEYMLETMKENFGKWERLPRERYSIARKYPEVFETVERDVRGVRGWTHNPFVLVTSALGTDESTDNLFEWEITFCWPIEMDLLYSPKNMAVVNVKAETMTPGGKLESRPTHLFLTKELFTRNGAYGYYSFRYQSKNGAGNRERLHIWSDSYIAISKLSCECKMVTSKRNEQLVQQVDVQSLKEL